MDTRRDRTNPRRAVWRQGVASVEYALTVQWFLFLLFGVVMLGVMGVNRLYAATAVPLDARDATIENGVMGTRHDFLPGLGISLVGEATGCDRAVRYRAAGSEFWDFLLISGTQTYQGGTTVRLWQFYPDPPEGGCN